MSVDESLRNTQTTSDTSVAWVRGEKDHTQTKSAQELKADAGSGAVKAQLAEVNHSFNAEEHHPAQLNNNAKANDAQLANSPREVVCDAHESMKIALHRGVDPSNSQNGPEVTKKPAGHSIRKVMSVFAEKLQSNSAAIQQNSKTYSEPQSIYSFLGKAYKNVFKNDTLENKVDRCNTESQKMLSNLAKSSSAKDKGKAYTSASLVEQSDKCLKLLKNETLDETQRSQLRMNAHVLSEKAASKQLKKGNVDEAFQIRSNFINSLGPPSLEGNRNKDMKDAFTNTGEKKLFGNCINNCSTRSVQGGHIVVDHITIKSGDKEEEKTTIRAKLNGPVTDNMEQIFEVSPEKMEQAIRQTLPKDFTGKVSVRTDGHIIYPKAIGSPKDKKFEGAHELKEEEVFAGTESIGKQVVSDTGMVIGRAWSVEIEGIGKLSIPMTDTDDKYTVPTHLRTSFNKDGRIPINTTILQDVFLDMDGKLSPEDKLKYAQIMLSMVGSGPVFEQDGEEDAKKLEMMDAFRQIYPSLAAKLDIQESTYNCSADELKNLIFNELKDVPNDDEGKKLLQECINGEGMVRITEPDGRIINTMPKYLELCEKTSAKTIFKDFDDNEIPGDNRLCGLMFGIGNTAGGWEISTDRQKVKETALGILKFGLMSTKTRCELGMVGAGVSPAIDNAYGGAGVAYARGFTPETAKTPFHGEGEKGIKCAGLVQFIINPNVVNNDPHARASNLDSFGYHDPRDKAKIVYKPPLQSINDLLKEPLYKDNEICLTKTVAPTHFMNMICPDQAFIDEMIEDGTKEGLIVDGKYNGIPVEKFFVIGTSCECILDQQKNELPQK